MRRTPKRNATQQELYESLKKALATYSHLHSQYYMKKRNEVYQDSIYLKELWDEVMIHRAEYLHLRMKYESAEGTQVEYTSKLVRFLEWRKEINISCTNPKAMSSSLGNPELIKS